MSLFLQLRAVQVVVQAVVVLEVCVLWMCEWMCVRVWVCEWVRVRVRVWDGECV